MSSAHRPSRRAAALTALVLIAGMAVASDSLHGGMSEIVAWSEGMIARAPVTGMVAFVVLSALSAILAFFSSGLLAPVAIAAWGKSGTFALLWIGWLLGGAFSYGVGRYLGRKVAGAMVGADVLATWEARIGGREHAVHVLLFQIAMPSEVLGYVLGVVRYSFATYIGVLAITEIPYALAVVYLSESFLAGNGLLFVAIGMAAIAVSTALYVYARRRLGVR
ncbi:MAG TPA: VTT domain-containing protein [Vicinamibacterales bacterium]|nr:VTT domain-containing protein [Vicinamibacterales bacterium]